MEEWQRNFILGNLTYLTESIDSSIILIYLMEKGVVSQLNKQQLDNTGIPYEKTYKLLDILTKQLNGYQHLAKALYLTNQAGAMVRLLEGVQENTDGNQFRYCGIEHNIEHLLSKNVLFEGIEMPLKTLYVELDNSQQEALKNIIDVSVFKCLNDTSELIVAKETTPPLLPYYIFRKLFITNKLDKRIFAENDDDIFVFENIQRHQLTILAQGSTSVNRRLELHNRAAGQDEENYTLTGLSSDEMRNQTSRFILLESELHYQHIVSRVNYQYPDMAKRPSVHYVKISDNGIFLEKSTQPFKVKQFISDEEFQIPQDELLNQSIGHPVIIFDTPGMGKSVLLAKLASQMKIQHPTAHVIFMRMQELVDKLVSTHSELNMSSIQNVILDTISNDNEFVRFVNTQLFTCQKRPIYLFLDAFDEVTSNQEEVALKIIELFMNPPNNFRIYATSRPHKGLDLERVLGKIAYGIISFELDEQMNFMMEYWGKQYSVKYSEDLHHFAQTLLLSFQNRVSKDERMITGIPLQCKMLADIYSKDIKENSYSLESTKVRLGTINDMYCQYFEQKFPKTLLQFGKCWSLDVHYKLALDLLFPDFSKSVPSWSEHEYDPKLLSFGILEVNRSGVEQFVHRTFAEFLVAKLFAANVFNDKPINFIPTNDTVHFLFTEVLKVQPYNLDIFLYSADSSSKATAYGFSVSKYRNRGIVFFLGQFLALSKSSDALTLVTEALLKLPKNIFNCSEAWETQLVACLEVNSIGLYSWLTSLIKHFVDSGSSFKILDNSESVKSKIDWDKPICLNVSNLECQILIASHFCSPELIKKHFRFASSIVKEAVGKVCFTSSLDVTGSKLLAHFVVAARGNYEVFEQIYLMKLQI